MSIEALVTEGFGPNGSLSSAILSGFLAEPVPVPSNDTVPPVLALFGSNPMTITQGQPYIESGYTAVDDVDGVITDAVVVTGSVNTAVVGQHVLTYTISDAAGNQTVRYRIVNVVAPAAPAVPGTLLEQKQAELVQIRAAIAKILGHGQSYMIIDGAATRQLQRANLKTLMDRQSQLEREILRLSAGGVVVNYGLPK